MESIRDFRARHENRRRLALACAKALEGPEGLPGTPCPYRLYLQVPLNFLGDNMSPRETGSVDLLICRGRDGLAAMAVVFDIAGDRVHIPERLGDMNIRRFALTGELDDAKLAEAAEAVRRAAAELPEDAGKISGSVKLSTLPLKLVLRRKKIPMPKNDALVRGQILYPDGAVTPYGARCCLVLRRIWEKDGWTDELDVLSPRFREAINALNFSRELRRPSQIPLRDRLDAVFYGEPSDGAYPAYMAALLDDLLDEPIEDLLPDDQRQDQLLKMIPDGLIRIDTYGGALSVARDLLQSYLETGQDGGKCEMAGMILAALLDWLLDDTPPAWVIVEKQSLRQRLAAAQSVLKKAHLDNATVTTYRQGAAARLGTGYPGYLKGWYDRISGGLPRIGKMMLNEWKKANSFEEMDDPAEMLDTLFEMYTLLVEPFYPDLDTWTLLREMLSAA